MMEGAQEFGMNSALWIAQAINMLVILLILVLPFFLWKCFKKRQRELNQKLDRIEEKIDDLRQNQE